jgi:hypothetical protein
MPVRVPPANYFTGGQKSKVEIDFAIYGPDIFLAIEVKHARTIRPQDLRGLKSFSENYPECQLVLLYRGTEPLKKRTSCV